MQKSIKILTILIITFNISFANQNVFNEVKIAIGKMESNSRYDIVNKNGFMGKYQFGAMGLVDLGIINKERYKANTYTMQTETRKAKVMWRNGLTLNSFVANPSNWNIEGGKNTFLNTPAIQEEAMDMMLKRNYHILTKKGFNMSDRAKAKSLLMAAHFGGITSAINYATNGVDYKDAFGTSISKYYGKSQPSKKVVFRFND